MFKKNHVFYYQGWDSHGHPVAAQLQAAHISIAKNELIHQGIVIKTIRRKIIAKTPALNATELLALTQQLCILVNAHLPIVFCLNTLMTSLRPAVKNIFKQMIQAIEHGKNLSDAMSVHAYLFPAYFIQLIAVGENSGQLGLVLTQLCHYQEKSLEQTRALKKAILYPVFVFSISLLITIGLLIFIVPQFQILFADFTASLPMMTIFVFKLSNFLIEQGGLCLIVLLLFGCGVRLLNVNNLLNRVPLIGKLIHEYQQIHYLRSLSVGLSAGLPLTQALLLAQQVVAPGQFAQKITSIVPDIKVGVSLQQAFAQTSQFSQLIIQLITIGEETSQLPIMFAESAKIIEKKMDDVMQHLHALLQPTLITFLGLILGGLIIALYLPVFKLGALY